MLFVVFCKFVIINFYLYGNIFTDGYREVLPNVNNKIETELKPFYYPTLMLLDFDNGYNDKYIINNSIWGR